MLELLLDDVLLPLTDVLLELDERELLDELLTLDELEVETLLLLDTSLTSNVVCAPSLVSVMVSVTLASSSANSADADRSLLIVGNPSVDVPPVTENNVDGVSCVHTVLRPIRLTATELFPSPLVGLIASVALSTVTVAEALPVIVSVIVRVSGMAATLPNNILNMA